MRHGNVNSLLEEGNNMGVGESVIGQRGDVHRAQHCPLGVKHGIPRITFDQGQLSVVVNRFRLPFGGMLNFPLSSWHLCGQVALPPEEITVFQRNTVFVGSDNSNGLSRIILPHDIIF